MTFLYVKIPHNSAQPCYCSQQIFLGIYTGDYPASKQNTINNLSICARNVFIGLVNYGITVCPRLISNVLFTCKETEPHPLSLIFAAGKTSELLIEANKFLGLSKQTWS